MRFRKSDKSLSHTFLRYLSVGAESVRRLQVSERPAEMGNSGRPGRRTMTRRRSERSGAAVVEFAVCLPILMVMILGSIEATSAIFLKQSLVAAAYEGVREAAKFRGSATSANQFATNVLNARQVRSFRVVLTPPDPTTVARGQRVSIEISANISANSPFIGKVIQDRTLVARAVMIKE